jgi:DNA-binding NarL/FixJ family response regulator
MSALLLTAMSEKEPGNAYFPGGEHDAIREREIDLAPGLGGHPGEKREADMKVLIADDSAIVRERLVGLLSELPEVEIVGEARTTEEAAQSIQQLRPDVVILDIQMPGGGSGIDVLRAVKERQSAPRVIMLTNHSLPQYRDKYLAAGADFFFDKSTEFEKVIEACRGMI